MIRFTQRMRPQRPGISTLDKALEFFQKLDSHQRHYGIPRTRIDQINIRWVGDTPVIRWKEELLIGDEVIAKANETISALLNNLQKIINNNSGALSQDDGWVIGALLERVDEGIGYALAYQGLLEWLEAPAEYDRDYVPPDPEVD